LAVWGLAQPLPFPAQAADMRVPGAVDIRLEPDGGDLKIGLRTAFLENVLEQELVRQVSAIKYAEDVTADITFEFDQGAQEMPLGAVISIGKYEYEHTFRAKTWVKCRLEATLTAEHKPFMEAVAAIRSKDGTLVKNCEIGGDLGNLFVPQVKEELNKRIDLQPDGTLWSQMLSRPLTEDPNAADIIGRMYLIQAVKDHLSIGASYCTTKEGPSVCIEASWPKEIQTAAIENVLKQLPPPAGAGEPLAPDLVKHWEANAPRCETKAERYWLSPRDRAAAWLIPSKESCETGDMTLFGGILCLSGYAPACDMVRAAQEWRGNTDGRWWRSPNHINMPGQENEFSGDQTLGVLAYLAATDDKSAAHRWQRYIVESRELFPPSGSPSIQIARSCVVDKGGTCNVIGETWFFLNAITARLGIPREADFDGSYGYNTDWMPFFAASNAVGYRMHLIGVQILLAKKLGLEDDNVRLAAKILAGRQPENPFFLWLVYGNDAVVTDATLKYCPKLGDKPEHMDQWSWERDMAKEEWKRSMAWECVFMAGLLKQ
jgi:hypothetical protein